MAVVFKI